MRHGSVREAKGLPQLLSTDKTSVQVSPSRTPSTARAEGQSLQDSHGWRTKASGITAGCRWIRGALPAPTPRAPKLQPCSAGAQGSGGRRGLMGSPRCCVGQGWSGGYTHPSAHPAAPLPTQSCSPGSHRAGELREWGGRSGLLALGPLCPAAGDVPEPPSCSVEGLLGFDPCPAQPLKPRTFQIQSRVEENEIDRGFHFSLGSHLFNPLLLLLDSTEMGSNHQNPGTTGVAHRQGPGPGLSSHSTMEITRFRLR